MGSVEVIVTGLLGSSAGYASVVCYLAAIVGAAYALFAIQAAHAFQRTTPPSPSPSYPPVTVLKPLHGAEPNLHANLASFCLQDYPAPLQIVFGVADPADPAVATARSLIAELPNRDLALIINPQRHGANAKVSNLINMQAAARHDVLVLADSDIAVSRDYLTTVVAALNQPGTGLVTCLYHGAPSTGIWSRLAAAAIDYHFLPNVLVGLKLGLATPCFGSTVALTKSTLAKFGGLQSVADQLADDYALGMAVRDAGLKVAIPRLLVTHVCAEHSLRQLVLHEIRWARTIRAMDPAGFAGLVITFAVPLALLGVIFGGLTPAAWIVAVALACRFALQAELQRLFHLRSGMFWLGPIRDILSFVVFAASFFGRGVEWRGRRYGVKSDNTLAYEEAD
jgi:ceramide glucosyltransferase